MLIGESLLAIVGKVSAGTLRVLIISSLVLTPLGRLRFVVAALLLSGPVVFTVAGFSPARRIDIIRVNNSVVSGDCAGVSGTLHRRQLLFHLLICLSLGQSLLDRVLCSRDHLLGQDGGLLCCQPIDHVLCNSGSFKRLHALSVTRLQDGDLLVKYRRLVAELFD